MARKDEQKNVEQTAPETTQTAAENTNQEGTAAPETTETVTTAPTKVETPIETLITIATDLNSALGLNPPIDEKLPAAELEAKIRVEATQIGTDANGFNAKIYEADKGALAPETLAWLEQNGAVDHIKKALETAAAPATGTQTPRATGTTAAAPAQPRFSKAQAMAEVIKAGGGTPEEIGQKMNAMLKEKGYKEIVDPHEDVKYVMKYFVGAGPIEVKDGKILPVK